MKKFLIAPQDLPRNNTVDTPKRRRDLNSPEENKQRGKRQQIDNKNMDLSESSLQSIAQLLDRKLEEKLECMATKEDVNSLREEIRNLKAENDSLRTEIKLLHENEDSLRKQLQFWDNKLREKNLVIHGLQTGSEEDEPINSVKRLCVEVLKTKLEVVDAHFLGNARNVQTPPILITLSSATAARIMLRNSKVIKGTSIFLQKDMSKKGREQLGLLNNLKREVLKINKAINVKVQSGSSIIFNGMKFWLSEDDVLQTNERENFQKLARLINNKNIDDVMRSAKQKKAFEARSSMGISSRNPN